MRSTHQNKLKANQAARALQEAGYRADVEEQRLSDVDFRVYSSDGDAAAEGIVHGVDPRATFDPDEA